MASTSSQKKQQRNATRRVRLRQDVAEVFRAFDGNIEKAVQKLEELFDKAHELRVGGSVGISPLSSRLSQYLKNIQPLYRENAGALFPTRTSIKADPGILLRELCDFSKGVRELLVHFEEFPSYEHSISYREFSEELLHWTPFLDGLQDELKLSAHEIRTAQVFLFDMLGDVNKKLERLGNDVFPDLIDPGVPRIRQSQKHSLSDLDNVSTVAALFASVTATMIQFSYNFGGTTALSSAVNVFWFTSLILSIAAAINSVLGQSWTTTIFRSPDYHPSPWMSFWMDRSSVTLLVLSVVSFFIGLALFVYFSNQALVTSVITTVLSGLVCCSLAIIAVSFVSNTWTFPRFQTQGNKKKASPLVRWWQERQRLTTAKDPEAHLEEKPAITPSVSLTRVAPREKASWTPQQRARFHWHLAFILLKEAYILSHIDDLAFRGPKPDEHVTQALEQTRVVQQNQIHRAFVKWLRFSPDGSYLATVSLDRKSVILPIKTNRIRSLEDCTTFFHSLNPGQSVNKIQWSPNGETLLQLKRKGGVSIWSKDGNLVMSRSRFSVDPLVYSASWLSQESFVSVEGDKLFECANDSRWEKSGDDIRKNKRRDIDSFEVRDMAVTQNGDWVVCIGTREMGAVPTQHERTAHRNEIRVYDLRANAAPPFRVPIYHVACHIALTSDDKYALISYEDKAPPQLWSLLQDKSRILIPPQTPNSPREDGSRASRGSTYRVTNTLTLSHKHTYLANPRNGFAAVPSVLGGPNECLVLSAGKAGFLPPTAANKAPALKGDATEEKPDVSPGEIFCWDRDTAILLRHLDFPYEYGRLTSLAWNPAPDGWMLVTGTHNGSIQVWSADIDTSGTVFPQKKVIESPQSTLWSPVISRTPTRGALRPRSKVTTSESSMSVFTEGSEATLSEEADYFSRPAFTHRRSNTIF